MSSRRPSPDQQEYTLLEQTPIRTAIGQRTLQSVTQKPHFWVRAEIDATALVTVRTRVRDSKADVVPSYNDYILKTVAMSLRDNPRFNAWREDDGLHVLKRVNIGFAVATEQGVMLPTAMDADEKPLAALALETKEMADLARIGRLRASLQMGAGFTISNIGPGSIDAFSAVISPPQTGILAIGSMKTRPLVVGDDVVPRRTIICTLTIDHAAADGADGAKFLTDFRRKLEDEEFLAGLLQDQTESDAR